MIGITLSPDAWKGIDADTEALLDKWLVAEGNVVRAGQPLANVVLIKTSLEIVAPADGRIEKILVPVGDTFASGQPIAMLKGAM